ncbi:MAG: TRAP transporter small permease [Hydrogenophaga sp.]|jgi:TRAP-type transport system small permease protein|uniref:TRAP transporter small permease n=1 Tax=Hydrogenophaga sp. TaxID=1904254 RepID=UPI0026095A6B|nr:TRAP transporter small permease [Hydrogenophaga sp.]MCV0440566.1 TRAP transporter small permease [Hydrogenophaga sp.]
MTAGPLLSPVAAAPLPIRWMGRLVDWAVIGIGATMATLVFINVALHVVGKDLAWVTELGELLMVWVTFLGGACAAQRGAHMSITEFIDKLGTARRRWADAAVQVVCLGVLAILVRFGWNLVEGNWGNQLTVLQWPMAWQYMGMALGCSLMAVFVAFDFLQTLRGVPREARYP